MRQQGDFIRSVYPKLILEGGTNTYSDAAGGGGGGTMPLSTSALKRPPLARAVHLTLGVAVLGSLLGGVQLFAMIKMLGLQLVDIEEQYRNRPDINQQQNIWAAYQVSMRVLEVTICTLLAVIATTPLRSDFDGTMDPAHPQRHSIPHPGHPLHQHLQNQHLNGSLPPGSVSPTALGAGLDYETESDNGCSSCCGKGKQHKTGYSGGSYQMRNGAIEPVRRNQQREIKSTNSCCPNIFSSCFGSNGKSGGCVCCTSPISCCGFEANPPREFEDEIYSEICSNNHSVRQVMQQQQQQDLLTSNHYSTLGRSTGPGTMLALGTLNTSGELAVNNQFQQVGSGLGNIPPPLPSGGHHPAIAVGSSSTLMMPYNHKRGAGTSHNHTGNIGGFPTQTATLLRSSANYHDVIPASALGLAAEASHNSNNPSHSSNANNSATTAIAAGSGSSSRATLESALYSNLRVGSSGGIGVVGGNGASSGSRPSSMLFNDSGFVR